MKMSAGWRSIDTFILCTERIDPDLANYSRYCLRGTVGLVAKPLNSHRQTILDAGIQSESNNKKNSFAKAADSPIDHTGHTGQTTGCNLQITWAHGRWPRSPHTCMSLKHKGNYPAQVKSPRSGNAFLPSSSAAWPPDWPPVPLS